MLHARRFVLLAMVLCLVGPAPAAAPPRAGSGLVTYDIADMIHKPGGKTGYDKPEDVVAVLLKSVSPASWSAAGAGDRVRLVDGTRLEIQATARQHSEIAQLLAALRGKLDVAVDLRADLIEVDRAFFDKEIQPKLAARSG